MSPLNMKGAPSDVNVTHFQSRTIALGKRRKRIEEA